MTDEKMYFRRPAEIIQKIPDESLCSFLLVSSPLAECSAPWHPQQQPPGAETKKGATALRKSRGPTWLGLFLPKNGEKE